LHLSFKSDEAAVGPVRDPKASLVFYGLVGRPAFSKDDSHIVCIVWVKGICGVLLAGAGAYLTFCVARTDMVKDIAVVTLLAGILISIAAIIGIGLNLTAFVTCPKKGVAVDVSIGAVFNDFIQVVVIALFVVVFFDDLVATIGLGSRTIEVALGGIGVGVVVVGIFGTVIAFFFKVLLPYSVAAVFAKTRASGIAFVGFFADGVVFI
tara:strand:- start:56 stop:679 length:624 start_codon:yes stop_codon:yes gene_type:complete